MRVQLDSKVHWFIWQTEYSLVEVLRMSSKFYLQRSRKAWKREKYQIYVKPHPFLCILVYNPLNPHIGIHILHSVLCTPPLELTRNCV